MTADQLTVHRAFYDAVEAGDVDLMASLWVDDPDTWCVHPGALPLKGTTQVLRSWTVLMANVGYIQFFLTDVDVELLPRDSDEPDTAVIVCTENIVSGVGVTSPDAITGGRAVCTSIVVRTAGGWKIWARHASPIADQPMEDDQS